MTELHRSFAKLDKYVRSTVKDASTLMEAKQFWESWIQSNRQMEKIITIDQLLTLLKRRGHYNLAEYNAFKVFKKIINDPTFNDMIDHHKVLVRKDPVLLKNVYGTSTYCLIQV